MGNRMNSSRKKVRFNDAEVSPFGRLLTKIRENSVGAVNLDTKLSDREMSQLMEALAGNRSVTDLHLGASGIGARGAEALAGVLGSTALEKIYFTSNPLKDRGARALAAALPGSSLRELHLIRTGIQAAGAKALAEALVASEVTSLSLSYNEILEEGTQALAACLRDSSLRFLCLQHATIGPGGTMALAAGIQDAPLEGLYLTGCIGVTEEGVRALAAALKHSNIRLLHLEDIAIGDGAGQALVEGARDTSVMTILTRQSGCSAETYGQLYQVGKANKERAFLVQMEVSEWTFTFRTAAGTVAAVLTWSPDRPPQELREAVFSKMRSSGCTLPDRHIRAHNLRIIRPDGQVLEDGVDAESLALQLGHDPVSLFD